MFDDWMDRYAMLIEMGKECPIIDDKYRDEAHLINGCQSRVWLNAELRDGKVYYTADSDAVITKGIISQLILRYIGRKDDRFAGQQIVGCQPGLFILIIRLKSGFLVFEAKLINGRISPGLP